MTYPGLLEHIPHQTGYLIINEEGGVSSSGGDLENDERVAAIILNMVRMAEKSDLSITIESDRYRRLSINFDDHLYAVTVYNKKIHVVKRKYIPADPLIV